MNTEALIATAAIVCGGLVGLYFYGKHIKRRGQSISTGKIKVQGENMNDLTQKMKDMGLKNKVQFEQVSLLTYEDIVKWINETDLKDIQSDASSYCCLVIRTAKEIQSYGFNLDFSSVPSEQLDNIFGTIVINETSKEIANERWMLCSAIDDDLAELLKEENAIRLK